MLLRYTSMSFDGSSVFQHNVIHKYILRRKISSLYEMQGDKKEGREWYHSFWSKEGNDILMTALMETVNIPVVDI